MIVVKSIGGLGNQLFQIAYALQISKQANNSNIFIDNSSFKNYKIRNYEIENFKINSRLNYIDEEKISKKIKLSQIMYRIYQKILKTVRGQNKIGIKPFKLMANHGLFYNFDIYHYKINPNFEKKEKIYIYGYFQSEEYFSDVKDIVSKEFRVNTKLSKIENNVLNKIKSGTSVAISIRIGEDYQKSKIFDVYKLQYYKKAMDKIKNQYPESNFFIFSDDIKKVKKEFEFDYPVFYVENFKEHESFRLLYSCDHFIISNSSFSWWGSYLGENPEKTILCPSKWYKNPKDQPDIYFDGITILDYE